MKRTVSALGWFQTISTTNAIATPIPRSKALEWATKVATAPGVVASSADAREVPSVRFHQVRRLIAADDGPTTQATNAITRASATTANPEVRRKLVSWSQTAP